MYTKKLLFATLILAQTATAQQLTTNTGAPVGDNQNSKTIGQNGQVLLEDIVLIEKLAAFDRERVPERVVHARGAGAYGEFVTSAAFSRYTKAKVFSETNLKTPVFVRFSTVVHGTGSPETLRDPRGFAVKFYTDEGNYDIVGNNFPTFFIRDAIKFPDMVHAFKPSPVTNKQDPNRVFDFFSHIPEATLTLSRLYSDYGTPKNYRQMNGSSVHAFKWVNDEGKITYVKYFWKSNQGEENLTAELAAKVQGLDFQHATVDLYQSILDGQFPSWDLYVQMIRPADLDAFDFNPLDATQDWPADKIERIKVGTMTLNKNADDYFQEVEQSAFSPGTLIPGIEPSEDKLLQGRLFSYFDTQRYRLGINFQQLPVNAPKVEMHNNYQHGQHANKKTNGDVNYQPSHSGYQDNADYKYSTSTFSQTSTVQQKISKTNDFKQAGAFYRSLTAQEKTNLVKNLSEDLKAVKNKHAVNKMVGYFYMADSDYGTALAKELKLTRAEVESAFME